MSSKCSAKKAILAPDGATYTLLGHSEYRPTALVIVINNSVDK